MKELNWVLYHGRFVVLGSILCIICSLFACDDNVADPPRPPQDNPIPVTSEQKKANNAQEADTITAEELEAYREELGNLSPDALIAKARSDVSDIKAYAKDMARHLADNKIENAEKIAADLEKMMKKIGSLVKVMHLRLLADEFSEEQVSTLKDLNSEIGEALEVAEEVNAIAIKLTEEK